MLARNVRAIRKSLGLTQADFAVLLGVTRVTVTRWETAKAAVTEPMAKLIRLVAGSRRASGEK